jgi:hypothetical protein
MSGTKAYKERKTVEHQSRIEQIIALNDNRTALLNAIADYMHAKYGDGCFYNDHPLVSAVLQSANGNIIDLPKLANDINSYQLPEV